MFDIMKYAEENHVEVDVRPGTKPVVWEFFIRDRSLDIVKFTQIYDRELVRQHDVDAYLEQRCNALLEDITEARRIERIKAVS
ncbi:MAG: hypothetical protein Q4F43_09890 [Eubacteriales bacterium]|nr:hypothetical protein [Eubacteriales bacterium]